MNIFYIIRKVLGIIKIMTKIVSANVITNDYAKLGLKHDQIEGGINTFNILSFNQHSEGEWSNKNICNVSGEEKFAGCQPETSQKLLTLYLPHFINNLTSSQPSEKWFRHYFTRPNDRNNFSVVKPPAAGENGPPNPVALATLRSHRCQYDSGR